MKKIQLRPIQEKAVNKSVQMLKDKGNSLLVAPTGAGKTLMLSAVADRAIKFINPKMHILVLVHRNIINNQNAEKFQWVSDRKISFFNATQKSVAGQITFGMVQTVGNEYKKLPAFDMIIIDECHHAMASSYLDIINDQRAKNKIAGRELMIFGTTATPNRGDGQSLIELFNNFHQINISELITLGYLIQPTMIDCSPIITVQNEKTGKEVELKGELSKIGIENLKEKICNDYEKLRKEKAFKKSVFFLNTHSEIDVLYAHFTGKGYGVSIIKDYMTDAERDAELKDFEQGNNEILMNVDVATEGYDFPMLDCVFLIRKISKDCKGTYVQMIGRALRPIDSTKDKAIKKHAYIVDYGGNIDRHGDLSQDVDLVEDYECADGEILTVDKILTESVGAGGKENFKPRDEKEFIKGFKFDIEKIHNFYQKSFYAWESFEDVEHGNISVACGSKCNAIVVNDQLYTSLDKFIWHKELILSDILNLLQVGDDFMRKNDPKYLRADKDRPILDMQIALLKARYPLQNCTFYRANCIICWDLFRKNKF